MKKELEDFFEQADQMLSSLKYSDEYRVLMDEIQETRDKLSDLKETLKGRDYQNTARERLIDELEDEKISSEDLLEKLCDIYDISCNFREDYIFLEFWASNGMDCVFETNERDFDAFVEEFLDSDFEARRDDNIDLYAREHDHINGCPDLDDIIADCKEECNTWCALQEDIRYFFKDNPTKYLDDYEEDERDEESEEIEENR